MGGGQGALYQASHLGSRSLGLSGVQLREGRHGLQGADPATRLRHQTGVLDRDGGMAGEVQGCRGRLGEMGR